VKLERQQGLAPERKQGRASLAGIRLGAYEVVKLIGAGGMGEVYRARDQRLQRAVALKVLPVEYSSDVERLARLEREARMLAALNHPNIAAIHGLEEAEGKRFLVLELVEGETLAERLKRGRIPLDETLDIGRQIAEGLEAAHEKGIIHRDLKPANIKITPEGKVKILDFGLAKAFHKEPAVADLTQSPTLTAQMTRPGVILGTVAYMSPEQARGKPVDKRADIWAFGCVLFECLTGEGTFQGETITEIVAAILKSEPDWRALPAATPWKLKDLLHRCLQKDPKDRLHDIADARIEMQEQMALPKEPPRVTHRLSFVSLIAACLIALVVGILIGPTVMKSIKPGASQIKQPVARFPVRLEPGHWLDGLRSSPPYGFDHPTRTAMAISSDGRFIVYSAIKENPGPRDKPRLFLRRFDQLEAKPIAGTEGGISPFLSPDDGWVGFWADGKLMKVSVEGGVPASLCDVLLPFGFSWGADNRIIFVLDRDSGLSRISADGGKPETLTTPDRSKGEFAHRLPHCLLAGKGILFTIMRHPWDKEPCVAVLDLLTRKWRVLLDDAADARYMANGHLAFLRQGTLMVVPFNPDELQVTGQPIPVVANIAQALIRNYSRLNTAAGQFGVSTSGSLVYASGGISPDQENSLVWVDYQGKEEPIVSFKAPFFSARLSPDGQRISCSTFGMEGLVWVHDLIRGTATKLASEGMSWYGVWTPDGRRLVFDWLNTGVPNIYWQAVDGSSPMERLTQSDYFQWPGSWTPDGETLAFVEEHPETSSDIWFLSVRDRRVTPFLNSRFFEGYPEFSPDGKWIAYVSDESGREEIYVRPFPGHQGKWQISNEGGNQPLWARSGRELFYRSAGPGYQVWVVDVQTGSDFSAGRPRLMFEELGYVRGTPIRAWDISADGRRFLMVKLEERKSQSISELILVQNWFEELKRLAPADK